MRKYFLALLATVCFCMTAYFSTLQAIVVESEKEVLGTNENAFVVVIDAGHGGMDGGVIGRRTGIKESDINLSITYLLKSAFEDAGFVVVLTRRTELGLSIDGRLWNKNDDMRKRREIIQNSSADLVLSIHQNFLPSSSTVRGGQVFYKKGAKESEKLALCVQDGINSVYTKHGVKKRSAKVGKYYMLECTNAPSLIVECGFLSSYEDEDLLRTDTHKKQLAGAILYGVLAYFFQR
jgi:N-acetylmuramoyl-L-alanine amidase